MSIADQFNPFDTTFLTDPTEVLARARREEPVFFSPIIGAWVVTTYTDAVTVLRDPETFSSHEILAITDLLSPEVLELVGGTIPMEGTLIGLDPPEHTRRREVLEAALSPSGVAYLDPIVRDMARDLIKGFAGNHSADLLKEFTYPLPLLMIARLIGIPDEEVASCREATELWPQLAMASLLGVPVEEQLRIAEQILDGYRLIERLIKERYENPRDDLISVVTDQRDEKALTDREMLSLIPGLFLAGHETTAHVLANLLWRLLSVPERWKNVVVDPEARAHAIDEALRCDTSVFGMRRIARRDVTLAGKEIKQGESLFVVYWSANHDETKYPEPDEFDLDREKTVPHLAFGRGIHHCIGAPLARIELRAALDVIVEELPDLRLAEGFSPQYQPHPFMRGMAQLPATW